MMIPTIHLNGTSKERLIEDLQLASEALEQAYQALKQSAPNGRDYYPQGQDAYYCAANEHNARLIKVDEVKGEIDQLIIAIDAGGLIAK